MMMIRGAKCGVEVSACARPEDDWVHARPHAGPSHRREQRSASSSCSVALQEVTRPHISRIPRHSYERALKDAKKKRWIAQDWPIFFVI